eukprot:4387503-Amphidinium_carterae.1
MRETQWFSNSALADCGNLDKSVRLRVFGDGVQVVGLGKAWGKTVNVITIRSFTNKGPTKQSTSLWASWWKKKEVPEGLELLWEI